MFKTVTAAMLSGFLLSVSPYIAAAAEPKKSPGGTSDGAMVIVVKATNACFSDMVRVTGFLVPPRDVSAPLRRNDSNGTGAVRRP